MENKKRLIDANALIEHIKRKMAVTYPNHFPGLYKAIEYIEKFPSVEADNEEQCQIIDGECNKCGWFGDCVDALDHKYCPGCGAKVTKSYYGETERRNEDA